MILRISSLVYKKFIKKLIYMASDRCLNKTYGNQATLAPRQFIT